ncbi:OsmC family protein [Cellulophaga sp. E16_2]|uniref:OsmC family protein n=1 Tax=Cellulophaga sp. E16_2 TaxID=2789297 RepID=UPI001A937331|nr:OsmC family protein [Cellulophaga sp. E16_2]MBO0590498.1 OsmC family protein [Cellulophaga sp. E16_2]
MNYSSAATSISRQGATIQIKQATVAFGITAATAETLPNPAELFLGSLSACMLKNVERFSLLMDFTYTTAAITIEATRLEKPPRIDEIQYLLKIHSKDEHLNLSLLKKNIEKHGTIYNTVKEVCSITGVIEIVTE